MKQATALEKPAPRSGLVSTLTAAASKLAAASIARNTRIAYQGALGRLQAFLREHGRDLTGLDDSQLAEYLTRLHGSGASPASAAMVCAAVRFLAKTTGQPSPAGPLSGRVMAGLRREGKDRGRGQVQGLQWGQADTAAAIASNGGQSLAGLRDAALIAIMSDCLLRVSEAVALQVDGLQLESDGTGRLTIGQSKTDQEGEGAVLFVGAPTVSRVRAWMRAASIESGPIFRRVRRGDKVIGAAPLSTRAARAIISSPADGLSFLAGPKPPIYRAASPGIASESGPLNRWPPGALRWWRCRPPGAGSLRPCRATTPGASLPPVGPWPGFAMADEEFHKRPINKKNEDKNDYKKQSPCASASQNLYHVRQIGPQTYSQAPQRRKP